MDNNAPVIDTKKNAAKFYKVVETYIKRDGINDLMDWLGSTDFFEAPASTRFHGSYEGGLCQHSLNVGKWLNKLAEGLYPGQYTKETLTLVALFHDVCKANCYKTSTRNVKNEQTGQWEKVPFFAWEEVLPFGGHGSKSMHLVEKFVKLTDEEASAINCHMGFANLMMESNGKRVLGAYFVADRFSNGFVQDVSRLVEPINRNRTDRFEIRVCDTNTPLVLAVPAVSAQAAPVNINVGITIKKTR